MSKMIYIDDTEPEGDLEPAFPPRDVTINRGVNAKELYEVIDEIGRGKFGTVYKCREKSTGLTLAAKFVPIPKRDDRRNVEREVEIMNSLQHHLIIQLFAAYEYQKMMCVVLELVEGGELFDRVIEDEFVLSEKVCIVFIRQVCEAMEFIHQNNILHLDLKPENILCLTKEGNRIKIIDFGLARKYDPDKKLQVLFGTPEFVAPEVVNFDCITYGTDMWSVGVICYVLISGISPFMGETDIQTMANVTIAKYDFDDESFNNVSPEALDFIAKLLVKDCSTRMTATQCLKHKWLSRRPRAPPIISPKPTNVPPLKLKVIPSPPHTPILIDRNEDDEPKDVELPKDNIKNFIERWENHPNSPYVFDVESNIITPLRSDSISSSRVCSPSPCESIDSVPTTEESLTNVNNKNNNNNFYYNDNFNNYGYDILEPETPTNIDDTTAIKFNNSRNFKDYLHSFDRRNSDTNYLLGRRSSGERMNLAEEIRKLSDHLLMLAEINTKLGRSGGTSPMDECSTPTPSLSQTPRETTSLQTKTDLLKRKDKFMENDTKSSKPTKQQNQRKLLNENKDKSKKSSEKNKPLKSSSPSGSSSVIKDLTESSSKGSSRTLSSTATSKITTKIATTSTKTMSSRFSREDTTIENFQATSISSSNSNKTKISSLSERLQKSIEEVPKILDNDSNKTSNITEAKKTKRTTKGSEMELKKSKESKESKESNSLSGTKTATIQSRINGFRLGLNPAFTTPTSFPSEASLKRMKFRVNQMSRDVPVGSPDTHQTVNLEEAANTTKDCLLHLLEKYNDTKIRNPSGRHQSISVDWNISDNLEYRTMSSINAFFQRNNSSGQNIKQLQAQLTGKNKPS